MAAKSKNKSLLISLLLLIFLCVYGIPYSHAQTSNDDCMGCHEDSELEAEDGRLVGVNPEHFASSQHKDLDCIDCHSQNGDFEDIPHFIQYQPVSCEDCHDDAVESFSHSFHGLSSSPDAPNCAMCHGTGGDAHAIQALDTHSSENSCRQCHEKQADMYTGSVHAKAFKKGKNSPGCTSCHSTHTKAFPPSAGAVNNLCEQCHKGAMEQIFSGSHSVLADDVKGQMSCASCHDVHATHKPEVDKNTLKACNECHENYSDHFKGSVHENLFEQNKMSCVSCHKTHEVDDASEQENFGCGACHNEVELKYRSSAHRLGRLHGDEVAANCSDCHEGHKVLPVDNPESKVYRDNIAETCGNCHGSESVMTSEYVKLPVSLPSYSKSVHGSGKSVNGKKTATCTSCHGVHDLRTARDPESKINHQNLETTCGQCHEDVAKEYARSIHGKALALGIKDAPSCTDCHDEHLILKKSNPKSHVNRLNQAKETCGKCHEDAEMAAKYGIPVGAVASYEDSYHGWAIKHSGLEGSGAVCVDCHNVHEIRSSLDPKSSTHKSNVVATCGRCHENSNEQFAASYTHILARDKMMIHDWVRVIYVGLITVVLGGMAAHNLLIFIKEMRMHYFETKKKQAVKRMTRNEIVQHMILFITFTGLAISGFALRFPDAWWVKSQAVFGLGEEGRRIFHRIMAGGLVATSLYHIFYLIAHKRGRLLLKSLTPGFRDVKEMIHNVAYYLGLRRDKATFGMYDYTQKAEYWALIWGTVVMALTGFVLMYPAYITQFLPAWVVRVCSVVHYYEAILAVGAIIIWHFFYTIFLPKEYPMSYIWINGRMPLEEWEHHHAKEVEDTGIKPDILEGVDRRQKKRHLRKKKKTSEK